MYGVVRRSKIKLEILGCRMISSRYGIITTIVDIIIISFNYEYLFLLLVCCMQVLTSMGLLSEVPLCNIKLSSPDAALLQVDSDDLMQLPKTPQVCTDSCYVTKGSYMFALHELHAVQTHTSLCRICMQKKVTTCFAKIAQNVEVCCVSWCGM
jgi:hypothetical protein